MEKCEPGENVNHSKKKLKSVNQNYVNQKMLVHSKKLEKKFPQFWFTDLFNDKLSCLFLNFCEPELLEKLSLWKKEKKRKKLTYIFFLFIFFFIYTFYL